jgi:NADH-quinone oxidoreductase subunit M
MLLTLNLLPALGALIISFIPGSSRKLIQRFSLFWSLTIFNLVVLLFFLFDPSNSWFQLSFESDWILSSNSFLSFGVDGLSLCMILLTAFLIPVCILLSWNDSVSSKSKEYVIAYLLMESFLFGIFTSLDILMFYLCFEAVLIPMFLIIGIYGSRQRRIRASYLLFLYTLLSSIFMFLAILYIYYKTGTTQYTLLKNIQLSCLEEQICWLCFFFSFAVKMPLLPFHIWLPEAHCEAPTSGSVILAGILLKLGGYGFLRFSIGLFPEASSYFTPLIYTISVFGVIYASITTLQQVDLKKIIAYSSVGHMGLVTIGLFSGNSQGILGAIMLMISHGIVSSALFLCVGILYERHHTRVVKYYSGLIHTMPLFSTCFIIFTLGNIGLPATSSFIGEFLIILGCFETNSWAALLTGTGLIWGACYGLWLQNRILFGNIKSYSMKKFQDLNRFELYLLTPFVILTFLLGLFPDLVISYITIY